jgi:glycine hydroxymethyltransferase
VGIDTDVEADGYPHFDSLEPLDDRTDWQTVAISGDKAGEFLHTALTSAVLELRDGESQSTAVLSVDGNELAHGVLEKRGKHDYFLHIDRNAKYISTWLRSVSDGFVRIDPNDVYARAAGPVEIQLVGSVELQEIDDDDIYAEDKMFFIGRNGKKYAGPKSEPLPRFEWREPEDDELHTTSLHALHQQLGAKMVPFAGYDMPVWYTSVSEEHLAVRGAAGIFDVTHMGVFDFIGSGAAQFLNAVTTNDVLGLAVGNSHYTYFLDVDGIPLDDLMIYRLSDDHFLAVVNASNNDKNWAWLKAVKNYQVMIDPAHPERTIEGADNFIMRDLRDRSAREEMRVDIALQGPKSLDILLSLDGLEEDKSAVANLGWAGITKAHLGGFDLIVSRTGYTGERIAYELFVHPDEAPNLFSTLIELGATPCGLAARDSLRTEAGLPLYGHELEGPLNLNPADAGFGNYVKLWKPFFIGKAAFIEHETKRNAEIVRFRLESKGSRPPHQGDPLVNTKGRIVGIVTSCSIDSDGYQLGQAYVNTEFIQKDAKLGIFSGSGRTKSITFDDIQLGKKVTVPDTVTLLSRFPSRKK